LRLGEFTAALSEHGAIVTGCDVAQEALRRARARAPTVEFVLTGEELPFADESFDVVWAGEVLEHVQDGLGLLAEVRRVLRPGGRLLLSTPDHGPLRRLWLGSAQRHSIATLILAPTTCASSRRARYAERLKPQILASRRSRDAQGCCWRARRAAKAGSPKALSLHT